MNNLIWRNMGRFALLLVLQLLVLNHVYLGGYIMPMLYVLAILMLPTDTGRIWMLLIAFSTGLAMDVMNNMLGFHALACTVVAMLRILFADRILTRNEPVVISTPSIYSVTPQYFISYLLLLLAAYFLVFYMVEIFSFRGLGGVLLSTAFSTLVTSLMAVLYQFIFLKKGDSIKLASLALLMLVPGVRLEAQTGIGKWRDCLDYGVIYQVAYAGGEVYGAARGGVMCYDDEYGTVTRLSKGAGLNDVEVSTIAYSATDRCLAVAYNNSNLDLRIDGTTYNISDIKRSEIAGDKNIYHIRFASGKAYLATGFGVVVVDIARHEIKETWYLGSGGTYTPIYDIAFVGDSIYAATGEGLKRLAVSERHPSVSDRWVQDDRLAGRRITTLENLQGRLLVAAYSSNPLQLTLYAAHSGQLVAWNGGNINSLRVGGRVVTVARDESVAIYSSDLVRIDSLQAYAHDAVYDGKGTVWVGHRWSGLVGMSSDGDRYCMLPGPFTQDKVYRLVPFNYRMMLCPGGHRSTYEAIYNAADLFTTTGSRWESIDKGSGVLDNTHDLLDAAVNPLDTNEVVAALWGSGVLSIRNNRAEVLYDETNTNQALSPYVSGTFRTLLTGAVAFDRQGTLWALVSHSSKALACRKPDGTWQGFPTSQLGTLLELDKLVWDSITGYKWFCGRSNMIYVHDGENRMARVNPNNGSKLNTDAVTALVQDQTGNLWVGTNKGLKVIYDGYRAFQNGGAGEVSPVNCSNITITNGEFSEYLMAYESITAIAVDGANRKWVGTSSGGLYLLSANGMEQLEHFTASNSPLFSDRIIAIGINERTGEVFVGTDKGLQVYRGTATYAVSNPLSEVYAFPNPVRPDYDGPIAIKGLSRNAIVHITDAAGHTVYSTTAHGGQAIWYGRTHSGDRVASGVYYVFASDKYGSNRSVAKILIVR